jgi:hypothetical protein
LQADRAAVQVLALAQQAVLEHQGKDLLVVQVVLLAAGVVHLLAAAAVLLL